MNKLLIASISLVMMVGVVSAQDSGQISEDIGLFAADHPLHNVELLIDGIGQSVGLVSGEWVAEKRIAEANDLTERGVSEDEVSEALDRVNKSLDNVPEDSELHSNVGSYLSQIGDNIAQSGNVSESLSTKIEDISNKAIERGGIEVGSSNYDVTVESGELFVRGIYKAPHSAFSVVEENVNLDNQTKEVTADFEIQDDTSTDSDIGYGATVITNIEYEGSVNITETGDYNVSVNLMEDTNTVLNETSTISVENLG